MQSKKSGLAKFITTHIKRLFRARNVIIISEHKVDHVPLSGVMQVLILVGMIGLFSGVSFITGSYMNARSAIRDKDRRLASTTLEKVRIGEEMDILKHDLVHLSQNGKELSAYSQFLLEEHSASNSPSTGSATPTVQALGQEGTEGLVDRVSYLEGRIKQIQDENDHLVIAVRERTHKKISDFEDIIAMTGLDSGKLEHLAASGAGKPGSVVEDTASDTPTTIAAPKEDETDKDSKEHSDSEGGPFIPYSKTVFNDVDHELLANVDRMVLLHDIIEQLPLSQPIADAQTTGPFGKRVDPFNGHWAIHPGVDLAGPVGAKIYCTSPGKVVSAGHHAAYGNMVDIDHGFGIVTRYGHMSKIIVNEGDTVQKGQQIGVQGSTGRSTGPHLHYEVRINDRPVNPVKFLHAGEYVSEN